MNEFNNSFLPPINKSYSNIHSSTKYDLGYSRSKLQRSYNNPLAKSDITLRNDKYGKHL